MLKLAVLLFLPVLMGQEPPGDMVFVPAGEFLMGTGDGNADEAPAHRVYVSAFYIDIHEVTNASFAKFVRQSNSFDRVEGSWFRYYAAGCIGLIRHYEKRYGVALGQFQGDRGRDFARWRSAVAALREMLGRGDRLPENARIWKVAARAEVRELTEKQATLPVRGVTWRDASAFARWAGKRLPTEAEWEKAARGVDGRLYPWGAAWDPKRCRCGLDVGEGPAPVGGIPEGASPYGCLDMAGNVWEWVADWYGETYYASSEGATDPKGPEGLPNAMLPAPSKKVDLLRTTRQGRESNTRKVIRGGGWAGPPAQARFNTRTTRRLWSNPSYWHPDVGFRCAKDAKPRSRSR